MASKYTPFWNNVVTDTVMYILRTEKKVEITLEGINALGSRQSWFGKNTFTKDEVSGGIMAHVKALQYTIKPLLRAGETVIATCNSKGTKLSLELK